MFFPQVVKPMVRPQMLSETLQPQFDINGTIIPQPIKGGKIIDRQYKRPLVLKGVDVSAKK
jgi:hypothetical protein